MGRLVHRMCGYFCVLDIDLKQFLIPHCVGLASFCSVGSCFTDIVCLFIFVLYSGVVEEFSFIALSHLGSVYIKMAPAR